MKVYKYASMHISMHAHVHLCNIVSMQVCLYVCKHIFNYVYIQICNYTIMQVCIYAHKDICTKSMYASMKVWKHTSIKLGKFANMQMDEIKSM